MRSFFLFLVCFQLFNHCFAQIKIPQQQNTTPVVRPAQPLNGTLKVICGADGELFIDGETQGSVSEGDFKKITVKAGADLYIQLKPSDGRKTVKEIVNVAAGKEKAIELNPEAKLETKYNSSILLESTLSGTIKINGEARGTLNANSPTSLGVPAGTTLLVITSLDGKYTLTRTLESKSGSQGYLKFELLELKNAKEADQLRAEEASLANENFIKDIEKNMVYVSGGSFTMGCTREQGSDCDDDEKPAHQVSLSSFYIGKYEVTQAQWRTVMGNNPSNFSGCENCPVENVSWNDTQVFLQKLNQQTGKTYRLPTEAEWEYAARGGQQSRGYKYSGSNDPASVAWYDDNSGKKTHTVGQKSFNELGIYDMTGNVWEWCSDWFGHDYYANSPSSNPQGPSSGSKRVIRGGSWYFNAVNCLVANRYHWIPGNRLDYVGFRLLSPVE